METHNNIKIVQVETGLIPIPNKHWGAVEKIIWEYHNALLALGVNSEIQKWNEVQDGKDQLVHCHMANTALDMKNRGIPYVYSLHDHHAEHYGKESAVYRNNLDAIKGSIFSICHSKHVVDYFDETDKLFYLRHGVNTKFFTPNDDVIRTRKLLMICNNGMAGDSSIDRKGFKIAIEAARKLHLEITIAGPENNLEFFRLHPDIEYDKLRLQADNPTDDQTLKLYQTHDIFMAPSMLEYGHPNLSILEAMSCGLPIVGTCNTDLPGMYRMKELSVEEAVMGIKVMHLRWEEERAYQKLMRKEHDWFWIALELKKMYDAAEINKKNWTSEDTKKAYLESYV